MGSNYPKIPDYYQQVEYLQTDGTAYIRTDYKPYYDGSSGSKIYGVFSEEKKDGPVLGCQSDEGKRVSFRIENGSALTAYGGNEQKFYNADLEEDEKYLIDISPDSALLFHSGIQNYAHWSTILPEGYTQVEYIEGTGEQYINTGQLVNSNLGFDISFSTTNDFATSGHGTILGAENRNSEKFFKLTTYSPSSSYKGTFERRITTAASTTRINAKMAADTKLQCKLDHRVFTNCEGTDTTMANVNISITNPLYIFGVYNDSLQSASEFASMKLYSLKLYQYDISDTDPVHIYYPCVRNMDNKPGLYDIVDSAFLSNAGTGEFIPGPSISTLDPFTNSADLLIFAENNNDEIVRSGKIIKCYSLHIYNGNELYRNYIPCYVKENGQPGFYETITDTFIPNSEIDLLCSLTCGPDIEANIIKDIPTRYGAVDTNQVYENLPEEYKQVEYIESNASQYINTGYYPNAATRFIGKMTLSSTNLNRSECLYGVVNGSNQSTSWELVYNPATKILENRIGTDTSHSLKLTNGTTVAFESGMLRSVINQNTKKVSSNALGGVSAYSAFIFAENSNGSVLNQTASRLYFFKILEGDDLVRNFVPCYRVSDSVIGLYETVEDVFYPNLGTGNFTKGDDVNPPDYDKISNDELFLYVYDTDFDLLAIYDEYSSLIWADRYDEAGDFELLLPYSKKHLDILQQDYFCRIDLSDRCMIIEERSFEQSDDGEIMLSIKGRSAETLLERRIVIKKKEFGEDDKKVSVQNSLKTLLNENLISPTDEKRQIPNFIFQESKDEAITKLKFEETFLGEDLYSIVSDVCTDKQIGFKVVLNAKFQFIFSLYVGKDRSFNQDDNEFVIFSPYYDNLKNSRYFSTTQDYKNLMYVEKDEFNHLTIYNTEQPVGVKRREIYINQSELKKNSSTTATLSDKSLRTRGKKKLSVDHKIKTGFEGEIIPDVLYIYRTDYFIGDKIQFEDSLGNNQPLYISEIVISRDDSGLTVIPTFKEIEEKWDE